ncbi:MAG: 1-acyl-sn-glycerol-3-phosphate acyltransferase, partial [Myxococcota bacterium]
PNRGPALLVCNHVSFVDAFVVAAAFRRPVRFIMDHRIYNNRLIHWIFRIGGVIPIAPRRDDPALLESAFDKTAAALRRGELVCIFPEGKITYDGELNEFRAGVERIVAETPVPVIPLALRGLWGSFFSRRGGRAMARFPRRFWSKIELRAGRPVSPDQATAARLQHEVAALRGGAR